VKRVLAAVISVATVGVLAACGSGPAPGGGSSGGQLTMGFSQVGAESGWRTANTKSIQDAAKAADIDLKFSDANGEQENQISAIRSFVQQRVDVIAFSPVVRTGWDAVLLEAKNAGIPVILTDRAVDTQEKDVYKTFLGADFVQEGQRAGDWVVKQYAAAPGPVNIVQLEGTTGADPALERSSGFSKAIAGFYATKNIRCNVLAPALVETPMAQRAAKNQKILRFIKTKQPLDGGRIGQPTDLDAAAIYFMSDASRFATGQVLAVDGGWCVSEGQISNKKPGRRD